MFNENQDILKKLQSTRESSKPEHLNKTISGAWNQSWSTYWWEILSKLFAVSKTEPSTNSSSTSSPCLMKLEIGPEWNSAPVGLKSGSIENLRIVFVIFNLFWK